MDKSSSKGRSGSSKPTPKQSRPIQYSPEKTRDPASTPKTSKAIAKPRNETIRLHITPLTSESAKAIVPAKYLPETSFHVIDTFPERNYGFVTLPRSEAEQLRRKYNGTVFRGVKMSVEEARPVKKVVPSGLEEKEKRKKSPKTKVKPSEREDGVLPGFELPEGRQVKRGWTKDLQKASKGKKVPVAKTECLFKTVLPVNKASEVKGLKAVDEKSRKSKGRTAKNQVIVKEFKNSSKFPEFLKMNALPTDSSGRSTGFVEGVGWVDAEGNVLEGAPAKRRRLSIDDSAAEKEEESSASTSEASDASDSEEGGGVKLHSVGVHESESDGSDTGTTSDESESEDSDEGTSISDKSNIEGAVSADEAPELESGSSEGSSSESDTSASSDSDSDGESLSETVPTNTGAASGEPPAAESTKKSVSSNFTNLTNIFKPKLSLNTESTSQFKFFGGGDFEEEEEEEQHSEDGDTTEDVYNSMPFTPVTPQTERRNRSGAPTPDTAVGPRFRDLLPFSRDISIERNYFPTLAKKDSSSGDLRKPPEGVKLLFPHTYNDKLHKISIWSSVALPKVLTTGEFLDRRHKLQEQDSSNKEAEDQEMAENPPQEEEIAAPKKAIIPKISRDFSTPADLGKPKTGAGSSIVGWAGKKKTFEDDDFDMTDPPAPTPPKAKTGSGSGVTGWAGKKMTFGDDDGFDIAPPTVETQIKAKTGVGSGVSNWAGTKKTFDSDSEGEAPEDIPPPKSQPAKAKISKQEEQDESQKGSLSIAQAWEKAFYENRGDWNRQWKRKKREVAKAKRKKERVKRGWSALS
ncbi:hypothetical protein ABW19_dt0209010 [Dactylella cylindrospora]|nr:hypothetical protein ABW19_dt0209010 [Dactylella cylindrospora]